MKKIAIFASGSGTNAVKIIEFLKNNPLLGIEVGRVYTNNSQAGVIEKCLDLGVPCSVFTRTEYKDGSFLKEVEEHQYDLIVLAGFLWLIPGSWVSTFPNKIINIHPSLLPKYGGKGMYGMNVHQAVVDNKEPESGITIHYVNDKFDEGEVIFQATTQVTAKDTAKEVAKKVQVLEHKYFPEIVAQLLK